MDLESIVLSEISQPEKDKMVYRMYNKKETNKTKQEQTHRYGQQIDGYKRPGGRRRVKCMVPKGS